MPEDVRSISLAMDTAKMHLCHECLAPARVMLIQRRHCVTRPHHSWCRIGYRLNNEFPHLGRPTYEDLRISRRS